jgi:hypothetical protein
MFTLLSVGKMWLVIQQKMARKSRNLAHVNKTRRPRHVLDQRLAARPQPFILERETGLC